MRFSKWHALGNSYLLVERAELADPLAPEEARRLCDPRLRDRRRRSSSRSSRSVARRPTSSVWNPDGSRAELSGNGARIAAVWLARRSGVAFPRVRLGERLIPARVDGERRRGRPRAGRRRAPRGARASTASASSSRPCRSGTRTRSSAGSPSARSCSVSARWSSGTSAFRGARTSSSCARTGPSDLTVLVWERGVGETLASGSSAAAAAAAAVDARLVREPRSASTFPGERSTVDIRGRARDPQRSCRRDRGAARRSRSALPGRRRRLAELDEPPVRVAQVRGAAPRIVARLDEEARRRPRAGPSQAASRSATPSAT